MTNWVELLEDPRTIRTIFGDATPSLEGLVLHELALRRDPWQLTLRFDLRDFPAEPPEKWRDAAFNCVQVRLRASGIHDLEISGFDLEPPMSLTITPADGLLHVCGETERMRVRFAATYLAVPSDSVSAYLDSSR